MKFYQRDEMCMSGGMPSVKVVLRNPLSKHDFLDYNIQPVDSQLAKDWLVTLKKLLYEKKLLEKNFCFLGFPKTARNLTYLCNELNHAVYRINMFNTSKIWQKAGLESYIIEDYFTPDVVRYGDEYPIDEKDRGLYLKQSVMNRLHNHFEILQGSVNGLSQYYILADYETKYAIRQLNNLCHEIESLVLSQRKQLTDPEWVRPSQITTFLHADRYKLTNEHRKGFSNGYDRKFGHVYMHWAQIGKTLFEVFRDENASQLSDATCAAITHLEFYSGEFDVEWGNSVVYGTNRPWHDNLIDNFNNWLETNNLDPTDLSLSLGHLPIGEINVTKSFGTNNEIKIRNILSNYLDIYKIEIDDITATFDYCWTDYNYKQMQIDIMKPGYDFSSRR
jgi:hypothetical protein